MATRSRIAQEQPDGTVKSIYCHWDGYPSNNGRILLEHYQDPQKVAALISLGALSYLSKEVAPQEGQDHDFESPASGVTVAYHRDRGEDYQKPRENASVKSFFRSDIEEWGYLMTKEGEWLYQGGYKDKAVPTPLTVETYAED